MSRTCVATYHRTHGYRPDATEKVQCELERGHSARGFYHFATYINIRLIWWRGKEMPGSGELNGMPLLPPASIRKVKSQ